MRILVPGALFCVAAFGQEAPRPEVRTTVVKMSLDKAAWEFTAEQGKTVLTNTPSGALTFSFPVVPNLVPGSDTASVNYLETTHNQSIAGYTTLATTLQLSVTGSVIFNYMTESDNTCVSPAHARFIIDTGGDGQYDRWWARPLPFLLDAKNAGLPRTMAVALNPALWSSVFGQTGNLNSQTELGFSNALKHVRYLGLTFGGGCFYGHGVSVSGGTAQLTILAFYVSNYYPWPIR